MSTTELDALTARFVALQAHPTTDEGFRLLRCARALARRTNLPACKELYDRIETYLIDTGEITVN